MPLASSDVQQEYARADVDIRGRAEDTAERTA
ncbi:hypothetical protein F4559_001137 [Saccharothrix violaceirubra]|uniref:Uncharacterized protein n=1 Tax=Saccharothrix violaceirubra TaxID=413306 RepID=A0A7W7SZE3_9PSEU|nr:hypothetical protein [Saccharothrix violaceirubra]